MKDISEVAKVITGRIDQFIYAFSTPRIPGFLKIGDTHQTVPTRLDQWRESYPELREEFRKTAMIASMPELDVHERVYFRDYSVHEYLENEKNRRRLQPKDLEEGIPFSKEFFKDATEADVDDAIKDITDDFYTRGKKYQFYTEDKLPVELHYERIQNFSPRPNQEEAIANFKKAVAAGRTNLLMYAVMRFGKSFTSMCCAVEMGAKLVVIVSAKADVAGEWCETVESHVRFDGFSFLTAKDLLNEDKLKKIQNGEKTAVFLTLQDLQGPAIKKKHAEIFARQIDLLIIDETHFGARAEKYGQVLRDLGEASERVSDRVVIAENDDEFFENDEAEQCINKYLKAKVRLHLSGTPYRILMSSEFKKEDMVAFCQFSDIANAQKEWDKAHFAAIEREDPDAENGTELHKWDNPYFGFPQMIRFAFHPNASAREKLEALKKRGISFAMSALLKPRSTQKTEDGSHRQFVFEQEILDLLEVIDGSKEDDAILGFLDDESIKRGEMCRHIVMVLPYRASCDAMEALIQENSASFRNLQDYEIINISGFEMPNTLDTTDKVKTRIKGCEASGKKTLTLTVNRMLTGSTVEEWDTMIFLKDTASPQEYDQAIFRLQNSYVVTFVDENGKKVKLNMKPQTLLVDFDIDRMFYMQAHRAQTCGIFTGETGNTELDSKLEEELRISPILVMNRDRIERVVPTDIIKAISRYSSTRGIAEEVSELPVDISLLDIDVFRRAIERENELGSKSGFTVKPTEGEGSDVDTGEDGGEEEPETPQESGGQSEETGKERTKKDDAPDPTKQIRAYYARIMFYAFLTKDKVISLDDIISGIETTENARIARHVGITKPVLECIRKNSDPFVLNDIDNKIFNINLLSDDTEVDPLQRAEIAVKKFGKLGESEVVTPLHICDEMVALLPEDELRSAVERGHKILDIAGKTGEFAVALYKQFINLGYPAEQIRDLIYTIPTSGLTYEFTRMVYEILDLNIANIAEKFNSYDMLSVREKIARGKKRGQESTKIDYAKICALLSRNKPFNEIVLTDTISEGDETVTFDIVIGNPPYQSKAPGTSTSDLPIFNNFMDISFMLSAKTQLLVPARFLFDAGGTPSKWNRKMLSDVHFKVLFHEPDSRRVFMSTQIPGGVAVVYRDTTKIFGAINHYVQYPELTQIYNNVLAVGFEPLSDIIYSQNKFNLDALYTDYPDMRTKIGSKGKDKRFRQIVMERFPALFLNVQAENCLRTLGLIKRRRTYRYINRKYVETESWIDKYKVFVPFSNGASGTLGDEPARLISKPVVGVPGDGITQTFIGVGEFETRIEAENLYKYIHTKFARALLGMLKVTQGNKAETWNNVPIQNFSDDSDIDWSRTIPEIDSQLYAKYHLSEEEIAFIESKVAYLE